MYSNRWFGVRDLLPIGKEKKIIIQMDTASIVYHFFRKGGKEKVLCNKCGNQIVGGTKICSKCRQPTNQVANNIIGNNGVGTFTFTINRAKQ